MLPLVWWMHSWHLVTLARGVCARQGAEFQYVTDLMTLREVFVEPLVASVPSLKSLLTALRSMTDAELDLESALLDAAVQDASNEDIIAVVASHVTTIADAHRSYAKLFVSGVNGASTATLHHTLPLPRCHGWRLLDFLSLPLSHMMHVVDVLKGFSSLASPTMASVEVGRAVRAAAAATADMAASLESGWRDTLTARYPQLRLHSTRFVAFDSFLVQLEGEPDAVKCDVFLFADRLLAAHKEPVVVRGRVCRRRAAACACACVRLGVAVAAAVVAGAALRGVGVTQRVVTIAVHRRREH